ncbi:hypothetical protein BGW38_003256, partial [Lunasporangiospora selenospora]
NSIKMYGFKSSSKSIVSLLPLALFLACTAEALWCTCITDAGDPFNDLDQTYSVCAQVPGAVYQNSDWGGLRSARCDVGSSRSAEFIGKCKVYGARATSNCY